eukprot:gene23137-30341_t
MCLWSAGVVFTNPGYDLAYGSSSHIIFVADWSQSDKESHKKTPLAHLISNTCGYNCKWRIRNQNRAAVTLLEAMTDFTSDQSIIKDANSVSRERHRRALHEEAVQLVESMPDFTPDQ